MIESPLIQEIVAERLHKAIELILIDRFGPLPGDIRTALRAIGNEDELDLLAVAAAGCADLTEFRARITA